MVRAEEGAAVPVLLFARPPIDPAEERTIRSWPVPGTHPATGSGAPR
jgi:hypothetical protein